MKVVVWQDSTGAWRWQVRTQFHPVASGFAPSEAEARTAGAVELARLASKSAQAD